MRQIPFTVNGNRIELQGVPPGTQVCAVPDNEAAAMTDARLHAGDLNLARQAIANVKAETREFSIVNASLFTAALVYYFRCFKRSRGRSKLDPELVFAGQPGAVEAHSHLESIRDKHVVHDENNYFQVVPFAMLLPDDSPIAEDHVVTIIAQAAIDREERLIALLAKLIAHAHRYAEAEADRETKALATRLTAQPRELLRALPEPHFGLPVRGDEAKPR